MQASFIIVTLWSMNAHNYIISKCERWIWWLVRDCDIISFSVFLWSDRRWLNSWVRLYFDRGAVFITCKNASEKKTSWIFFQRSCVTWVRMCDMARNISTKTYPNTLCPIYTTVPFLSQLRNKTALTFELQL